MPALRHEARRLAAVVPEYVAFVRRLLVDPRVRRRHRVVLLGLLAYLLSPIDLVPDFIPVVGQLDDVVVAALVLRWLRRSVDSEVISEARRVPDHVAR
jgi:uncharacterized membrane protein YkvA (DUF1232 family)